jgi:peptide/nickel transport system substrate-binding protein
VTSQSESTFVSPLLLSRRSLVAGGSAFAALAAAGGIPAFARQATPTSAGEPKSGGTLKLGVQGDPVGLDPHISILDAADIVFDFVYEGLVRLDPTLEPIPSIAESWVLSDDGLTYTFALRSGVTFHNGRALDSSDFQYSIQRVMDPATASPDVTHTEGIAGVEAPDPATVVITLKAPDASFLTRLARPGLSAVPKEEVEKNGDLQQVMVGTGPFVFSEYIPNTSLSFTKNQAYWDTGKPYIDQLDLLILPNDTSRTTALVTGTVDMIEAVPHKDVEAVKGQSSLKLAGDRVTNLRWIAFNLEREPFNNLEFRKAIGLGLDRQPIIDTAVFGFGEPLLGMYPVEFWAGYQGVIPDPDPDAARAALASITLPEGFKPKLLTWAAYQFLSSTSIVVQEQLKNIGIESEIDPQENATYIENFFGGNFDIAVMGAAGYSDPDEFLRSILGTGEVTNASRYSNEAFDALLDDGLATQDRSARADIYQLAQQIAINDAPIIPLYTSNTYEGMSVEIEGFEHSLSGRLGSIRSTWINR